MSTIADSVDQDQTAHSVQSDLKLHCLQKLSNSQLVVKEFFKKQESSHSILNGIILKKSTFL